MLYLLLLFVVIGFQDGLVVECFSTQPPTSSVKVRSERHLPNLATPQEARQAWLEFVWEKGGGLPLLGVLPQQTREPTEDLETQVERRMLVPIGMQEELLDEDDTSLTRVKYQVAKGGLLSTEIVPNSHLGVVTFDSDPKEGTVLTWEVTFDTTEPSRTFLWQAVTERTITDTCNNFQASVATPQLYQRTTLLRKALTPAFAMDQWLEFAWKQGGGIPLPIPPILLDDTRWIVPPFLQERLLSTQTIGLEAVEVQYKVENPSLFTYQVYSHRGRVRFSKQDDNNTMQMKWEIEIRPYPDPWAAIVKAFTAAVVSCYARNFKCHVQEGKDAMVALKPPRGGSDNTLLQVRKDSWIGGVLDAHLGDKRSTGEQTLAILQPWTWGRTAQDDEEGEGEQWIEGYLAEQDTLDSVFIEEQTFTTTVAARE